MTEEITIIRVGDFTAGAIGLRGIFDEIKKTGAATPELIKKKLVKVYVVFKYDIIQKNYKKGQ